VAVDTLSRRALLEMKRGGDYAPRVKIWPPEGYTAPTAEEFHALLRAAQCHAGGYLYRSYWDRMGGDDVLRHAQLAELAGPTLRGALAGAVYDYARALRAEMNRRGLVFQSLLPLRCEACSHASERLFEATQTTHPGLSNRSDNPVDSAWFCARCWSGDGVTGGDELKDEG
jgi:hypothetical protein